MKNIFIGAIGAFAIFALLSYKTTSNENIPSGYSINRNVVLPLKQKGVRIVNNEKKATELMKKGWVLEDVDYIYDQHYHEEDAYFTLVLY